MEELGPHSQAFSAFQLKSSECRNLLNGLTNLILTHQMIKTEEAGPLTIFSTVGLLRKILKENEKLAD